MLAPIEYKYTSLAYPNGHEGTESGISISVVSLDHIRLGSSTRDNKSALGTIVRNMMI